MDTNVLFSALYSSSGASHQIFKMIVEEQITLAITPSVYFEYSAVLMRSENLEKIGLQRAEIEDLLDFMALLAQKHSVYFLLRPNLKDEEDDMIAECAFASNSDYLITSNVKDFLGGELKPYPFKVVTPSEFMKIWRKEHE